MGYIIPQVLLYKDGFSIKEPRKIDMPIKPPRNYMGGGEVHDRYGINL